MARGRQFWWQAPDGNSILLSDRLNGYWVLQGVTGLGKPTYTRATQPNPETDGYAVTSVRATERQIFLPMEISGDNRDTYLDRAQILNDMLDPELGEGYLIVLDGSRYVRIKAQYTDGFAGDEGDGAAGEEGLINWAKKGLVLSCSDPFFESVNPIVQEFSGAVPIPFFPILPLNISTQRVFGNATVNNPGSKSAWGVFNVLGPATSVDLRNLTTGRRVTFTFPLADGEGLTIDMRPGHKSAIRSDGTNMFRYLTKRDFWPFERGDNSLVLSLNGATTNSRVSYSFYPRYESLV